MRLLAKEDTPSDWISQKIGSYVLGHKGGAALRPNDFSDTGFPVIPKKAIQPTGELLIENPTYCTNEFASNNKRSIVDSSYTITTLRDLVPTGPTIGTVVNFSNEEKYILSQGVYGLRLNDDLDKKYLSYLSNTAFYRKVMQRIMVGSTQVHIRTPEYLDLEIQLPPLPEQQKIAKILSTWDKAISTTERLIDNSTQQKKALMQQLLTGKKRLLDDEEKRFAGEWIETKLGGLYSFKRGKGISKGQLTESGNKCVLYGELYTHYDEVIHEVKSRTMETNSVKSIKGDVLIPASTTTTGIDLANATAVLEDDILLGGDINILRPKKAIDAIFMAHLLTHTKKFEIARKGQGITIIHVYGKDLASLDVLVPINLKEQQKIATVLTTADKEIELLKQQLADLQQEKKALMQVLLTGKKRVKLND